MRQLDRCGHMTVIVKNNSPKPADNQQLTDSQSSVGQQSTEFSYNKTRCRIVSLIGVSLWTVFLADVTVSKVSLMYWLTVSQELADSQFRGVVLYNYPHVYMHIINLVNMQQISSLLLFRNNLHYSLVCSILGNTIKYMYFKCFENPSIWKHVRKALSLVCLTLTPFSIVFQMLFKTLENNFWQGNYCKIPKVSPGAYIFQRPFLRGLYSEGLIYRGKFAFQNRLG